MWSARGIVRVCASGALSFILSPSIGLAATCSSTPIPTAPIWESAGMTSVTADAANDVWAGGNESDGALLEHWDGEAWHLVTTHTHATGISAMAMSGPSDIWGVGSGYDNWSGSMGLHWNGTFWDFQSTRYYSTGGTDLSSVVDFAPNDVWAVGDDWEYGCYGCPPVDFDFFEHWDGTHWRHENFFGNYVGLAAIAGSSSSDLWMVEYAQRDHSGTFVASFHRQGFRWQYRRIDLPEHYGELYGLAIAGVPGDIWGVGVQRTSRNDVGRPLLERWNAISWKPVQGAKGVDGESLSAVAAINASDVWAVGGGSKGTIVEHWDGATWSKIGGPIAGRWSGVTVLPGTNQVMVVGTMPSATFQSAPMSAIYQCR